jgi:alpha-1,3-mannosyltransferase
MKLLRSKRAAGFLTSAAVSLMGSPVLDDRLATTVGGSPHPTHVRSFGFGPGSECQPSGSSQDVETRIILGVPVVVATSSQSVKMLDACFEQGGPAIVAFANVNALNIAYRNRQFRSVLRSSIVINDGIGVDIASRLLFGSAFPQNLNGTDFIPQYLQNTRHRFRIFLFGGVPGVAERAGDYFSKSCPQHVIVGCRHGYLSKDRTAEIVNLIKSARADVILVATGNPGQELWLADNLTATGCRLGFAVGALFDFLAGQSQRAPAWMRSARLEWIHRLLREPRRLWRRYLVGNPVFLLRVLSQWFSAGRTSSPEVSPP